MADKTLGEILHEAREKGNDGRDRPMFLAPWSERDPRLKMLDEAMAEAVAKAERKKYDDRITFIEGLASDAKAAAAGYPEHSPAWIDMTARAEAYSKAAAIARGETGGEGWGEP